MPETTLLNVVLLPSPGVATQAIRWSQELSHSFQTKFVLDGQTYHPHATVYQAAYPVKNLEKIKASLQGIAAQTPRFSLQLDVFSTKVGFVFADIVKTPQLVALHNQVLESLNPLREGELIPQDAAALTSPEVPEAMKQSIREYGYAMAKEAYSPHITITRLENWQDTTIVQQAAESLQPQPLQFQVTELVLANIGHDGTCNEIKAHFPFQSS